MCPPQDDTLPARTWRLEANLTHKKISQICVKRSFTGKATFKTLVSMFMLTSLVMSKIWEPPNGHLKWFKLRALLRSVLRHYVGFLTYQTIVWSHDSQHSFAVMFNLTPLWETLLWRAIHLTRCLLRCKSIEYRGESLKNLLVIILYSVTVFFRKEQHYQA